MVVNILTGGVIGASIATLFACTNHWTHTLDRRQKRWIYAAVGTLTLIGIAALYTLFI